MSEAKAAELEQVMIRVGELAKNERWWGDSDNRKTFIELQTRINELVPPGTMP